MTSDDVLDKLKHLIQYILFMYNLSFGFLYTVVYNCVLERCKLKLIIQYGYKKYYYRGKIAQNLLGVSKKSFNFASKLKLSHN